MSKLLLTPDNSSYAVQRGSEVLTAQLNGGVGRYRRDIFRASFTVNVIWILDAEGYEYLEAFFRTTIAHGSLPFTIDLLLDHASIDTYTAYFIKDSKKLSSQKGLAYTVTAQLEVIGDEDDATADGVIVAAFELAHGG